MVLLHRLTNLGQVDIWTICDSMSVASFGYLRSTFILYPSYVNVGVVIEGPISLDFGIGESSHSTLVVLTLSLKTWSRSSSSP